MPVSCRTGAYLAVLATTLLAAACATTPRSPVQVQSDELAQGRIYAALNADPTFYFRHVDVSVDGGVARLRGYVWSQPALVRAQEIARNVPGVTAVRDEMELQRSTLRGGADGGGG
jgi:osmotically-inducible protein OsmY